MALTAPSSTLTGQTIAASYDQVLFLDSASGVTEATLKIVSGTAGKTALSISDEHVLVKGVDTNNAAGFEVQQTDGTSILKIAAGTPSATLIGPLTVGANDLGHDVIFHGNTDSSNMTWDTSEDDLVLNDATLSIVQDDAQYGISVDQNTNQKAIYVDHDGVTSESSLYFASPTTTTGTVIRVDDCDALTTGRMMELKSASTSDGTRSLVQITNDAAAATGATCLSIQQDSTGKAISATGGIVEEGGTLKENLLTNSGFGVWGDSTLENVGSDLVTGGAFTGGASGWTLETGWSASSNHLVSTSGGFNNAAYRSITTVAGKLYRVSITCDGYTDGSVAAWTNAQSLIGNVLTGTGTSTVIFEATGTSHSVGAIIKTAGSDFTADDFTCFEVTPACIASNNLAMDGWFKGSSTDIYRQHNDGGTLTKDGSFYGLYMDWAAAGDYVQWPGVNLRSKAEHYQRFAGRTVTFGCWMKTSKASHGKLTIEDNSGTVATSGLHTGGGGWEWLEITHTMGGSITLFSVLITGAQAVDGTDTDIYASQPMLVFGSSIGEGNYTSPQGEIIYLTHKSGGEHSFANFSGTEDYSSAQAVNTEAESSGMIPKGVKAVLVRLQAQSSTVPTLVELTQASGLNTHYTMLTQVSNQASSLTGWMTCDDSGDFDIAFQNATDNVLIAVQGVHLH